MIINNTAVRKEKIIRVTGSCQFNEEDITDSVLGQSGLQNIYGSVNNKGISLSSRHVKNRAIDSTLTSLNEGWWERVNEKKGGGR